MKRNLDLNPNTIGKTLYGFTPKGFNLQRRFQITATINGCSVDTILRNIRVYKDALAEGVVPYCECGCGGDNPRFLSSYFAGATMHRDLLTNK